MVLLRGTGAGCWMETKPLLDTPFVVPQIPLIVGYETAKRAIMDLGVELDSRSLDH